jgi:hypothetical protein
MPITKVNSRSPKIVKYSGNYMIRVDFVVYVYSGIKNTDKGSSVLSFSQYPQGDDDFVVVDWSEIANEYIKPNVTAPLNDNVDYVKWLQIDYTIVAPDTNKTFWAGGAGYPKTYVQSSVECAKKVFIDAYSANSTGVVYQTALGERIKVGDRIFFNNAPLEELVNYTNFIGGYYYMYILENNPTYNTTQSLTEGFLVKIDEVAGGQIQVTDIKSMSQVDETLCV